MNAISQTKHRNPSAWVALLRGINLGGKNMIPMEGLKTIFACAGCPDARTYIQSGNVLFRAESRVLSGLASRVSERIREEFGYRVPVILRSEDEMESCIASNPFAAPGANEKELHVLFLDEAPGELAVSSLDPRRSHPDSFVMSGQDVYLRLIKGAGVTKLTNQYFDGKLGRTSTGRNWNTVRKILALMRT